MDYPYYRVAGSSLFYKIRSVLKCIIHITKETTTRQDFVGVPSCYCSCFAAVTEDEIFLGRNSDFLTSLEKLNLNVIYKLDGGAFSFIGNTTAFVEMEDGINEFGLAAGLTSVHPSSQSPGMNAGMILRYFLEKCRTVPEAVQALRHLPIASAQTFTLADSLGNIAVIECGPDNIETACSLHSNRKFVCAANTFRLPAMKLCNKPGIDDWSAGVRYDTLINALGDDKNALSPSFAMDLLAGKHGFICQYDRRTGRDTVWSAVYDVKRRKIFRCEGNPGRRRFREDTRFFGNDKK